MKKSNVMGYYEFKEKRINGKKRLIKGEYVLTEEGRKSSVPNRAKDFLKEYLK